MFQEFIQEFIKENISKYEGRVLRLDELSDLICEKIVANRSYTHSAERALLDLFSWKNDVEAFDRCIEPQNPLLDPEEYQVRMIEWGVSDMLKNIYIDFEYDEEIELTSLLINTICECME